MTEEEKLHELEKRNQALQKELRRLKRKPEGRIGYALLAVGFALIGVAIHYSHNVSSFIGIALVFWGALLLYVRPTEFIRKEVLDSISEAQNIPHLVSELGYTGTLQYISPGTLWGLNNTVIWIPEKEETEQPSDEALSNQKTVIMEPKGLVLTPPGQGLSRLLEEELSTNFARVDMITSGLTWRKPWWRAWRWRSPSPSRRRTLT
jgi:hypothetical protein